MKVPTRKREHGLQFNITPLIDVVFLLIIFFLVASHFVRAENKESVDLPKATQTDDQAEESPNRLVVTVTADRQLHVGGNVVGFDELEQRISAGGAADNGEERNRFEVRIRGDQTVPYSVIEPIILACARAGVTRVKFSVLLARE
ncbi:MAG: biopolymer transporter ExbD [Planctomycetes bacterium]|nr:biopolymer transporter ExbD [Planctomycetota bacterium]